jgi:hypothetical protein
MARLLQKLQLTGKKTFHADEQNSNRVKKLNVCRFGKLFVNLTRVPRELKTLL